MSPVPWIEGAVLVYYFYLSLGSAVVSCLGLVGGNGPMLTRFIIWIGS